MRLNRLGLFIGNDRIRQGMIAVVQVSRNAVGAEPVFGPPVVLPAAVTRRLPSGMIMPADQDPGPVSTVRDPPDWPNCGPDSSRRRCGRTRSSPTCSR
ncbi:hypothetical protein ACFSTC_08300 [Nonomuraea ferruginea]